MAEQVAELEAYRTGARALAARILSAQERERVRISRELHDDTGQALTLLLVRLQLMEDTAVDPQLKRDLAELREVVGVTLDGVRRLAVQLGPSVLEDLGLCAALEWLTDRVRAEAGLRVDLELDCRCEHVPHEIAVAMFRVAQEALTNIVRHAAASRTVVAMRSDDEESTLTITDDGIGFDVETARDPGSSVGLFGMRERVALVGGQIAIASSPGHGTHIEVHVPIKEALT